MIKIYNSPIKSKNILLVGGTSLIGSRIFNYLTEHSYFVCPTSSKKDNNFIHLDLLNPDIFNYDIVNENTIVLLLAAVSSPDQCAAELKLSREINIYGTSSFIKNVILRRAKVIFFSSDAVYGEKKSSNYNVDDISPVGFYASMKNEIEKLFMHDLNFKSIRMSYVFSYDDKFTSYLRKCHTNNEIAQVYNDLSRNIIYIADVIEGLVKMIDQWDSISENVINFGGPELLSRIDFANIMISKVFNGLAIKAIDPHPSFFNERARITNMTSLALQKLLNRPLSSIDNIIEQEFQMLSRIQL
jgi:dTDP-4-dehydrorhamnose reductase